MIHEGAISVVSSAQGGRRSWIKTAWRELRFHRWMYLMVIPGVVYFSIFAYAPMFGLVIAFKRFNAFTGIWDSPWVGLGNFKRFFQSIYFMRLIRNTVLINLYSLAVGFPAPIILALLLNEVTRPMFKRTVQTLSYLPHFVSTVVVTSIIINLLSMYGPINTLIGRLGLKAIPFMNRPEWFRHIYVWSGVWQGVGWGSIIYLAGLAGIDPMLYESAGIDGAGRLAKMWYISIPGILPTIMVLLLLSLGSMLSLGFEKIYLLYSPNTYETADVISTYVYRAGLLGGDYSFGTAVGLFNAVINVVLLALFNWLAGRLQQQTLW